jgi:hypothetical protein
MKETNNENRIHSSSRVFQLKLLPQYERKNERDLCFYSFRRRILYGNKCLSKRKIEQQSDYFKFL